MITITLNQKITPVQLPHTTIDKVVDWVEKHYDKTWADIIYSRLHRDNHVLEFKEKKLKPNIQRCVNCQYSAITYNGVTGEIIKVNCSQGQSLLTMTTKPCILIK